ncbi:Zinc finger protein 143 [Hondaea fermentalgiana]|uniref:Zinc finger protein 143 n=1 Tax=Hondaea fermentalgiana TaxID=2315210 RepID=A0A2R5GCT0_9STRA|nr:Zinc finger protein 143 [Hondaea fermentalgiana]|eukprot:GBG27508.1 Zinc finger protein 143 [Hondaea fermentalgiana]
MNSFSQSTQQPLHQQQQSQQQQQQQQQQQAPQHPFGVGGMLAYPMGASTTQPVLVSRPQASLNTNAMTMQSPRVMGTENRAPSGALTDVQQGPKDTSSDSSSRRTLSVGESASRSIADLLRVRTDKLGAQGLFMGQTATPTPDGALPSMPEDPNKKKRPRAGNQLEADVSTPSSDATESHDQELLSKIQKKGSNKPLRFECSFPGCKRRFAWKWTMETHARTHLGDAGRVFVCKTCKKGFFTVGCLRSHEKIHSRSENPFPCFHPGCKKGYRTSEGLSLHIKNHHSGEKKWKCPVAKCNKSFVRQADCKLHVLRVHCKEKPFPCSVASCDKSFACLTELKRHIKIHKRENSA